MSSAHAKSDATAHPAMDMKAHEETWAGFMRWTVRSSVTVIVILVLMAIFLL